MCIFSIKASRRVQHFAKEARHICQFESSIIFQSERHADPLNRPGRSYLYFLPDDQHQKKVS